MANLHLFTGDAAAATIRSAHNVSVGESLVQHDVISCGPVRAFGSRDEWIRTRDDFWEEVCGGPSLEEFPADLVIDAERLGDADRLILWVGAGLSDRLLLPSVLALADVIPLVLPPVEVVEITTHRSLSAPVLGWGMLRPADVGQPLGREVTAGAHMRARHVWAGLTASSPTSYLHALDTLDEDPPLLAAMATLIERYPDTVRGLGHWDTALLSCVPDAGTDAFTIIGGAIGANHRHLDPVGDVYLFWRLRRMAAESLREPLLELSGDLSTMRHCRVAPTAFGRQVREGAASHVEMNGIDDWIGGVHLRAASGSPWYRRTGELIPRTAS
ncbi:MAG TPA: hypothetical protein VFO55_11970 [Gemmatimonadaceae bacterium]|nr:hypothetical protein [Gemmatimonadaceae bacterium]